MSEGNVEATDVRVRSDTDQELTEVREAETGVAPRTETIEHNPQIPCELQGGHRWSKIAGKNMNEIGITLEYCKNCHKVVA